MNDDINNNFSMENNSYDELNTTCSILMCLERAEEILMESGYSYNEKFKLFEKYFDEENQLITVAIDLKKNNDYRMIIDLRGNIKTVTKENKPEYMLIKYLGQLPTTELDFNILCYLLDVKIKNNKDQQFIDPLYFKEIMLKFQNLLITNGYEYNKINKKYFKQLVNYTDIPIYLSIYIDVDKDVLQISEEYSYQDLINNKISNEYSQESVLTLYHGKIPKTKFEFHTLNTLIELYLD